MVGPWPRPSKSEPDYNMLNHIYTKHFIILAIRGGSKYVQNNVL